MNSPRIHSTPPDAVKSRVTEKVFIDKETFILERPGANDFMLDHQAVRAAYKTDDYIPYWAEIWPASRMLAKAVLREKWERLPQGPESKLRALEIGCGLGLAGIAALKRGLHVTFSDIDELAVRFASENAKRNGFTDFDVRAIDLRSPPDGVQFQVILGADLLYEPRMIEPVIHFLKTVLAPAGVCLLTDPDRVSARPFEAAAREAGLNLDRTFARAGEPGGERVKGWLYRIAKIV